MKIKKEKLIDLISEGIMQEMAAFSNEVLDTISHGETVNVGELQCYNDIRQIKDRINEIWNIFIVSYKDKGGLKSYQSANHLLKSRPLIKIVVKDDKILACATYRKTDDSYKMTAIGCDQTPTGKMALQQIVQSDITDTEINYWCEASGPIEHYFKKYNGYAIPNTIVPAIITPYASDVRLLDDGIHYERMIGNTEPLECVKMIFGFKNREIYDKVVSDIDNYYTFLKDTNKEMLMEDGIDKNLKRMAYIAECLYSLNMERGFNEFIPSWYKALNECYRYFTEYYKKTGRYDSYVNDMAFLLDSVTELRLEPFTLSDTNYGEVCEDFGQ